MDQQIAAPEQRLSKYVKNVWIIREIIGAIIGFVIIAVLYFLDARFSWWEWIGWVLLVAIILFAVGVIWSLFIEPSLKYNHFRYDVSEEFLQIKQGILTEEHQLVPMTKIQAVATNQGPIMRKYGLYAVSITTMASNHEIPALSKEDAFALRNQIAHFAKIKEVE
ncbi:PH domain-containing protein [Virgibacillus siamensis]|uniref:PH domain-containing protein n=1 Tax=Virgibacillus siamensis TaxID=480071 RepID=A0ABP3RDI0_9BACI